MFVEGTCVCYLDPLLLLYQQILPQKHLPLQQWHSKKEGKKKTNQKFFGDLCCCFGVRQTKGSDHEALKAKIIPLPQFYFSLPYKFKGSGCNAHSIVSFQNWPFTFPSAETGLQCYCSLGRLQYRM